MLGNIVQHFCEATVEFYILDIALQLSKIISHNLHAIWNKASVTNNSSITDVPLPNFEIIYLHLNTDGGQIAFSQNSIWPIFLSILNLSPQCRSKFKNIILGGMWISESKPEWDLFFIKVNEQLLSSVDVASI